MNHHAHARHSPASLIHAAPAPSLNRLAYLRQRERRLCCWCLRQLFQRERGRNPCCLWRF
jgi:hypothetical protein